jgi:hypothetical protein
LRACAGLTDMDRILKPTFERADERGILREVLNEGTWESVLCGTMTPGAIMGNHYHKQTLVFYFLTRGCAQVRTLHTQTGERSEFLLRANEGVLLKPDESHAITYLEESDFLLLKSRRYDPADADTYPFPVT